MGGGGGETVAVEDAMEDFGRHLREGKSRVGILGRRRGKRRASEERTKVP